MVLLFEKNKRLEKIDFLRCYPKGTLLLQDYNPKDQGHVGIMLSPVRKVYYLVNIFIQLEINVRIRNILQL